MILPRNEEVMKLPASADFHVHLRDGPMMSLVVTMIRKGGVDTVYVMPNLVPPITSTQHALDYRKRLKDLEPKVTFLMSLYLHASTTPATIIEAKKAGITGVKSYPAGVTTNSEDGTTDYTAFYPVFAEMERQDLVLNLHGECPSTDTITVMTAEAAFLPTLHDLHSKFPHLRIVLEHLSTASAVSAVQACGPNVAGSITAHHLFSTVDDWQGREGNPHTYCKPVPKTSSDREALLRAAASGNPKFFFGSDSAPHPVAAKEGKEVAAGVFTQPYTTQLVAEALEKAVVDGVVEEESVTVERLKGFMGEFGRTFYKVAGAAREEIELRRGEERILDALENGDGSVQVVPFRRGEKIWSVRWVE